MKIALFRSSIHLARGLGGCSQRQGRWQPSSVFVPDCIAVLELALHTLAETPFVGGHVAKGAEAKDHRRHAGQPWRATAWQVGIRSPVTGRQAHLQKDIPFP